MMRQVHTILFIAVLSLSCLNAFSQERTIEGVVRNEKGFLPGAMIVVKGTTKATASDVNGKFQINVFREDAVLVFSFVGYQVLSVPVANVDHIEVMLGSGNSYVTKKNDDELLTDAQIHDREKDSIKYYSNRIKNDWTNPYNYVQRAAAYRTLNKNSEYAKDVLQAIQLNIQYNKMYLMLAQAYFVRGNYIESREACDLIIEKGSKDPQLYYLHGNINLHDGKYADAIADFNQAISLDGTMPRYYNNRGYAYYLSGQNEQALADFSKGTQLGGIGQLPEQKLWPYYHYYDSAYAKSDKPKVSEDRLAKIQSYTNAIAGDPQNADNYNYRGVQYFELKNYTKALEDFNKAVTLRPGESLFFKNRGHALYELDRYQEALNCLDTAIRLKANDADAFNKHGWCNYALKRYAEAIDDYSKAISIDPRYGWYFANRGECKSLLKQYNEALADMNQALTLDPKSDEFYNKRGDVWYAQERYEEATADYTAAIGLDPKNPEYFRNRAFAKQGLQKQEDAIFDYDEVIALDPKATYYYERGNIKYQLKRYKEAMEDYDYAIARDQGNANFRAQRGFSKVKLGQYEEAMQDCEAALRINAKSSLAYSLKSEIYIAQSKFSEAIEAANQAIAILPSSARYNRRGYAYFKLGRYQEAIDDYDQAIKTGGKRYQPEYVYRDEAVAQLSKKDNPAPSPGKNYFISLQWLRPVDDINELPSGIYTINESNELNIRLRATSNIRLAQSNFKILIDGKEPSAGGKMTLVSLDEINDQGGGDYMYEYKTSLKVPKGRTSIRILASYDNYTKPSQELVVNYAPEEIDLHILAIGTQSDLKYSQKDARDFVRLFKAQAGEGRLFRNVWIDSLIGTNASAGNIVTKIEEMSRTTFRPNDVILLFISSHGFIRDGRLRIMGSDFKTTLFLRTSVDLKEEVVDPLSNLNCKKFIFLDACHSGAAVGADMAGSKSASSFEINQAIGELLNASNECTIFSSSSGNEMSWEDDTWQNGAFTKALKEGLGEGKADENRNGIIRIQELYNYIRTRVPEMVKQAMKKDLNGNLATQTPKWNQRGDVSIYLK